MNSEMVRNGFYNDRISEYLNSTVVESPKKDICLCDVGSHNGIYGVLFRGICKGTEKHCIYHSFEAQKRLALMQERTFDGHTSDFVPFINNCFLDGDEFNEVCYMSNNPGASRTTGDNVRHDHLENGKTCEQVKGCPFEDPCPENSAKILKVDIEGHDLQFLIHNYEKIKLFDRIFFGWQQEASGGPSFAVQV